VKQLFQIYKLDDISTEREYKSKTFECMELSTVSQQDFMSQSTTNIIF